MRYRHLADDVANTPFAVREASKQISTRLTGLDMKAHPFSRRNPAPNEARDATAERKWWLMCALQPTRLRKRDIETKEASIDSRFATYETEEERDEASKKAVIKSRFANHNALQLHA